MLNQATASDLPIYDIFVPQKVPTSKISDDVIECGFWFGPPIKTPGYAYAQGEEAAFRAVPPNSLLVYSKRELTFLLAQEDQQTFPPKHRSPQTLFYETA